MRRRDRIDSSYSRTPCRDTGPAVACLCYGSGMRERLSTTVDPDVLARVRALDPGATDASLVERAFRALLSQHRRAEVDAAYDRAYAAQPLDAPDEWGDLESFGAVVRGR